MVTYSNPYTFVRLCVEHWKAREWRVQVRNSGSYLLGTYQMSLPDGTTATAANKARCFLDLAEAWARRNKQFIELQRPEEFYAALKIKPPEEVDTDTLGEDDPDHYAQPSFFDEILRQAGATSLDDLVGKNVKFKVPKSSGNPFTSGSTFNWGVPPSE